MMCRSISGKSILVLMQFFPNYRITLTAHIAVSGWCVMLNRDMISWDNMTFIYLTQRARYCRGYIRAARMYHKAKHIDTRVYNVREMSAGDFPSVRRTGGTSWAEIVIEATGSVRIQNLSYRALHLSSRCSLVSCTQYYYCSVCVPLFPSPCVYLFLLPLSI